MQSTCNDERKYYCAGAEVKTDDGRLVGHSKVAAEHGIAKVVLSRNFIACPGMASDIHGIIYSTNSTANLRVPLISSPSPWR